MRLGHFGVKVGVNKTTTPASCPQSKAQYEKFDNAASRQEFLVVVMMVVAAASVLCCRQQRNPAS